MFGRADAGLPRLDVFDQEFGPGPATILREPRRGLGLRFWSAIVLVLGAGVISALALAWPPSDGWLRPELQLASTARDGGDEQIVGLQREVALLKYEIKELTSAQQQAADTIAALKAAAQDPQGRMASMYWYSDPAALSFGIASRAEAGGVRVPTAGNGARTTQRSSSRARERRTVVVGAAAKLAELLAVIPGARTCRPRARAPCGLEVDHQLELHRLDHRQL